MIKQKGVTLIEMLIAVAVIGVLTAIAYPSYQDHVLKGHRTQAMGDLIKIQLELEANYTKTSGGYAAMPLVSEVNTNNTCSFCDNDTNKYLLSISNASKNSYTIIAEPQFQATNDTCLNKDLTLNQNGKGSPEGCW
ncbi:prepilin-type cleavage/methylation domain-containing protein [Photobacterium sp. NCIMB 13483]|uniref:type IV pilin protein n=1 Tax=Photobacterium sp. NCIMB 13483 TaxID=2022103 RepID=UPI000D15D02C|nr:type IV pilin protein [Photobacterium sp. NCIMB 13483]PST85372.1 prepilin-type cleavage/methylation domain-containing protein [Photobacterium sp. NCIMB 13483]